MGTTELTNKVVKTRKHRLCDYCGEPINYGDLVRYRAGILDGDFFSVYEHQECYSALKRTDNEYLEDGYMPHEQLRGIAMQDDPR